jgi:hypothetical protein
MKRVFKLKEWDPLTMEEFMASPNKVYITIQVLLCNYLVLNMNIQREMLKISRLHYLLEG